MQAYGLPQKQGRPTVARLLTNGIESGHFIMSQR